MDRREFTKITALTVAGFTLDIGRGDVRVDKIELKEGYIARENTRLVRGKVTYNGGRVAYICFASEDGVNRKTLERCSREIETYLSSKIKGKDWTWTRANEPTRKKTRGQLFNHLLSAYRKRERMV